MVYFWHDACLRSQLVQSQELLTTSGSSSMKETQIRPQTAKYKAKKANIVLYYRAEKSDVFTDKQIRSLKPPRDPLSASTMSLMPSRLRDVEFTTLSTSWNRPRSLSVQPRIPTGGTDRRILPSPLPSHSRSISLKIPKSARRMTSLRITPIVWSTLPSMMNLMRKRTKVSTLFAFSSSATFPLI